MKKITAILIIFTIILIFSCNKLKVPQSGTITFSSDTVFFDTIFTQVGSTTRSFVVYNTKDFPIKIDNIYLQKQQNSKYRLNIDGLSVNKTSDVIIDAHDSMFVFVEVTIDPGIDSILVQDAIIFQSGDNSQKLFLNAVGKDVHLFNGQILQTQTWTNDKAYLIYNSILVDTLQTLTIEAGVHIYSHLNSAILCQGTIIANGTQENPIVMRGDRIDDSAYFNQAGQWVGMCFLRGNNGSSLNYVNIYESMFGIFVDSMVTDQVPTIVINNSKIINCSNYGLYFKNTYAIVLNSIISNSNLNNVQFVMSGRYEMYNCTIQNDNSSSGAGGVGIQNFNEYVIGGNISALFYNTIIYGSKANEFVVNAYQSGTVSLLLKNCLLKIDPKIIDFNSSFLVNCVINQDPKYKDVRLFNYHLMENSSAINKGDFDIINNNQSILRYDMDNTDRLMDQKPDIGALEYK